MVAMLPNKKNIPLKVVFGLNSIGLCATILRSTTGATQLFDQKGPQYFVMRGLSRHLETTIPLQFLR
jgi:hypothetical protein